MTKKISLNFPLYIQIYSFITLILYGYFLFIESLNDKLPIFWLPVEFIIVWQWLAIIFTLLLNNKWTRILSAFFFICNAFVFYFLYAYHVPVDKVMFLNVLQTDREEITELLNLKWLICMLLLGIIPSVLLLFINIRHTTYKQNLKCLFLNLFVIVFLGCITYTPTYRFLHRYKYLQDYIPPVNYLTGGLDLLKDKLRPLPPLQKISEDIAIQPVGKKPNLIVFIMGETARAANFSLNGYHRKTNQALQPYADDLIYYPNVEACGTSTAISVPCIFSVYDRKNFKNGSETYTENILDIFKKADYKIHWLENDGGCKDLCNRVLYEEPCDEKSCLDEILLTGLASKIKKSRNNQLIILHTRGSHGPAYHLHYDAESEIYKPICTRNDLWNCLPEEVVNVYDNTIHYTSKFIARTIDILKQLQNDYNPILIYTSDHGESLMENGVFLHAAPYGIAPREQKEVPMLIWLPKNNSYHLNKNCLMQGAKQNHHSHDNIFHSLLGLSDIKSKHYQPELDIFADCKN